MRIKLLLTFALLLTAVTGAWALTPQGDDVWDETTKTLTVNSNPEDFAYSVNTDIQHLVIASGVTSIGNKAFAGCSNIATMTVDASNTKYDSRNGCNAIIEKSTNTLIVGCKNTTIPDDVTSIKSDAFKFCSGLASVEIPASVTSIGFGAFDGCSNLATVTFASGSQLTSIGNYAFEDCSGLTSIEIPAGVTTIGNSAFQGCSGLTSIEIPAGVTTIGNSAFQGCSGLTSIEIPANVTSIGGSAFNGCSNLTTVTVYAPSCTLGGNAFGGCGNLANIYVLRHYKSIYENTDNWRTYSDKIKEMDIPHDRCGDVKWVLTGESPNYALTITGTGAMADYDNYDDQPWYDYAENIKTIVIGADVTTIGDYAFASTGLTSIVIPASVTSIGNNAFKGCEGLKSVSFAVGSKLTSIGDYAFAGTGLTSIEIPASVESIGVDAFIDCSNIVTMTVDGDNAVYDSRDNCNAIIEKSSNTLIVGCKNTTIPDDVTSIGNSAFYGCTGLTSIEIPASVGSIGDFAFAGTDLTSIEIPASVTSIGDNAFRGCSELATVTVYAPSCTLGVDAFDYCGKLANIYVFSDRVEYYKGADNWSTYEGIITEMPNPNGKCGENVRWVLTGTSPNYTLTITGTGAMADYASTLNQPWKDDRSSIKTVVIGAGVTSIGKNAFRLCSNLATVTFAAGSQLTSIGNSAFANTGLTSIEIPANVTSISNGAFINCSNLEAITVEAGNAVYDSRDNCNAIIEKSSNTLIAGCKNTTIPDDVTSIGDYAFNGCTGLTSIEIPASVTSIGEYAFKSCTGLTSIEIPAGVTSIGVSAFEGCSGLTSIEIPAGVTSIGGSAFYGCTGLTSIEIPASVTTIGNSALKNCSNLATVTVYAPSCTLGNNAFVGCNNLTNIYVLSNYVGTYKCKNNWKDYADKISVMFDGTSTTTMNIPEDVEVNSVLYNRTFTEGKPSTVMLPFSLGSGQTLTGGTLYKFSGVTKNETTGKWEATMTETTTLQANTPYLLLPDENLTDGKVTFDLNNSTVILNTKDGGGKETADQGSHWTFKGTYEYMKWTTDTSDPDYNAERKAEIGRAYGFAGVEKGDIKVGDFVKVASGAKIRPMGCYLLWNDTPNASRAAARSAATEELPQSITVRLVSADGEVTGIGEIDTKTGEMTFDSEAWYTLNGVRLSGKPTKKGLYIMNGKKVVIK